MNLALLSNLNKFAVITGFLHPGKRDQRTIKMEDSVR